jgi:ribosomal protein S18 acetylase RimI-like enzyme
MPLRIREFVQGQDEAVLADVMNRSFKEFEEFRSLTSEDIMMNEKAPNFAGSKIFIALDDGEPVGMIRAHVDKMRTEKKGFIRMLGVAPEFRRRGIGRALAKKGIENLKERGMEIAEAEATLGKPGGVEFWEHLGFRQVRVFSLMKRSLEETPSGVGENRKVRLRTFVKGSLEDLKLINFLENEAFREHYNFRPHEVDETRYFLEQDPTFRDQEWLIAYLEDSPVGYVGLGIDAKSNREKNVKVGWIMDIGVLKPHRKEGIGARLLIEGMKRLKTKGMTEALLGVDDLNVTKAIRLYEKLGFVATRKDAAYQKSLAGT